jgi:hypothetical protein
MMNDYPNQSQQNPYQQTQAPAVPTVPAAPGYGAPQQRKPGRRKLWIVLGVIAALMVACGISGFVGIKFLFHNGATDVATQYYTAIKSQDYGTAAQFVDPSVTLSTKDGQSQQFSGDLFTQLGQDTDTQQGTVTAYSITASSLSSDNGVNTAALTLSVTRNGSPYDVHLKLQQEGNSWKIVGFDSL